MTDPTMTHTPDMIFTAAIAAAQRVAAETVSAAILAAERRGYERGLAEAAARSPDEGATLDSERICDALRKLADQVESLDRYDPGVDVEVDTSNCEEIEVPSDGDSIGDVHEFVESHGGSTLVSRDEIEVCCEGVENSLQEHVSDLRAALRTLRTLIPGGA